MKRYALATAWLLGMTVPVMVGALFLFGCCILPFHQVLHRIPLCQLAASMLHTDSDGDHGGEAHHPSPPAQERQQMRGSPLLSTLSARQIFGTIPGHRPAEAAAIATSAHRSFITLGALRCDQDVGMHRLLTSTFRI